MRKAHISLLAAGMVLVMGSSAVKAVYEPVSPEDRGQILNAELRTRVEYDDNVWTYRSEDEVDSFKVILQPRVKLNYPIETSHLVR
jgi:membrane protein implicated in regulation of membrane protease activity